MSTAQQDPTGYAHIISTSPIMVDLEGGRRGLVNPAWCGWVSPGITGAHPYSGYRTVVDCPDCIRIDDCDESDGCSHHAHK
ncbi:hypothetical protein ACFW2K_26195 [Streptomyces nigra]|uniref:Uncharacterized protein n=1 Tax=Streptomyces sp. FR1 TaxID=349971 RepID=V9Z720_9ACTN|nr:hypothetical protein [Streptomyces sp. FR1]AHE39186.1 hypothetical protein pFRL3_409 [Streptomyces sp. FR1]